MVSKKGIKKIKASKPKTPAVESIIAKPNLESDIIPNIVKILAPEMNKSIEAKFEEMKTILQMNYKTLENTWNQRHNLKQ